MQAFFCEDLAEQTGILDANDSRHCVSVLRKREGDTIYLLNGKGQKAKAYVRSANPRKCSFEIYEKASFERRKKHLHIGIAPTKNIDRFEFFLEKATEIGVEEITPLLCRYSERKIIKDKRLMRILIAALKQSERTWLPKLNPLQDISSFLKEPLNVDTAGVLAYVPEQTHSMKDFESDTKNWRGLIGPEGGFSEQEVELAKAAGYRATSLGDFRLRTETAGIVLAAQVAQHS